MIQRSSLLLGLLATALCQGTITSVHAASSSGSSSGATILTVSNFEQVTDGKSIFIKFFAPWCAHCRSMAEDWDALADDYANHPVALIGSVDCTSDDGQPLCEDFDIKGFPTLVYGDPMSAETYDGGHDYDSMKAWAEKHITKPICSMYKTSNCNDAEQKMIEALSAKSDEELEAIVAKVEESVKSQEKVFDEKVAAIQAQYDELVGEFNKNLDSIKEQFHYKYVEQLLGIRSAAREHGESYADGDEL